MSEATPPPVITKSASDDLEHGEIPFGIRALEQGIEVEGVWISRPNTPVPSIRGDSRPSSLSLEPALARATASSLVDVDAKRASNQAPDQRSTQSSRNSSPRSSAHLDRLSSMDLLGSSSSPLSLSSITADGTTTQMMIDYHRNKERRRSMMRNSLALDALEGRASYHDTTLQSHVAGDLEIPKFRFNHGSPTTPSRRQMQASDDFLEDLTRQASKRLATEEAAAQIDKLLQKHRSMQVAEEGFLPRSRRPASIQVLEKSYSNDSDPEPRPLPNPPSPPLTTYDSPIENHDSSHILRAKYRAPLHTQSSDIDSSPTHTLHKALQSSPDTYLDPNSPLSDASSIQRSDSLDFSSNERTTNLDTDEAVPQVFTPKRESQVLRKVNSGFEIMVPGTFGQRAFEDALVGTDGGNKRRTRRLQKVSPSSRRRSHVPVQVKEPEDIATTDDASGKRRPNRLQKKRHHSTSSIPNANIVSSVQKGL